MPSPFPGMDPYLEHPALWPGFHHRLVVALADAIGPVLAPRYYVSVEERTYVAGDDEGGFPAGHPGRRPDLTVSRERPAVSYAQSPAPPGVALPVLVPVPEMQTELYLEIRDASDGQLVTAVELLSPANKRPGPGRRSYLQKRALILHSSANLVEIDLLRSGEPMPVEPPHLPGRYSILVSRAERRPEAALYAFSVRQPIPAFPLPLLPGDPEPPVRLRPCLDHVYDHGLYARRIDYGTEPVPPLAPEDAAWARQLAQAAARP